MTDLFDFPLALAVAPGIPFAVLSLACAGVNDVVFKKYTQGKGSYGAYVFGIGVAWTCLQLLFLLLRGTPPTGDAVTLGFGAAVGLCLVLSNLLLLESLSAVAVSVGSTIYRLNTVGVVLLSFVILGETLDAVKAVGILAGIGGVLFLYNDKGGAAVERLPQLRFFGLAVAASALRALYGVLSKAGISAGADPPSMILITSISWIAGGLVYSFAREGCCRLEGRQAAYSIASGILIFAIVEFLTAALVRGRANVVVPVANLSFIVAIGLSAALNLDRLTAKLLFAMTLAAISVIVLSLS